LQVPIKQQLHNRVIAGRCSIAATYALVAHEHWWPHMLGDVEKFCLAYNTSQQVNPSWQRPSGYLHPIPRAQQAF
jgi:hypothetical protein